jgi:hypothetical protein
MTRLILDIQKRHHKATKVRGHRQLVATQCPGFDAQAWWDKTKAKPARPGAPALTDGPRPQPAKPGAFAALITVMVTFILSLFGGRK